MAVVTFAPTDAYAVMNDLVHQATGQNDIEVVDTSSFIDAGKLVLDTGVENVFNALNVLIGRTIIASRPYTGKFNLISRQIGDAFENRVRKISIYAQDNQASGMFNTDITSDNLGAGLTNTSGVGSMWDQVPSMPVQEFFYSDYVWDKAHTQYIEQIKIAFTNERDFINFINGTLTEIQNDIESTIEANNRSIVIDRIAGTYLQVKNGDLGAECAVNLTKAFNDECHTAYTTAEILSEHLTEFLEFYVAKVKIDSDRMENRSAFYHDPLKKTVDGVDYYVLRHTPKSMQRFIYYSPFFTKAKARVLPEIFNPQYLDFKQGEAVDYWQSFGDPEKINVKPALPGGAESEAVEIPLVIGMLFDEEALLTNNKFTGAYNTPIEARHVYFTTWYHYKFSQVNSYSENCIIYYMEDLHEEFTGDGTETDFTLEGDATEILSVTVDGEAVSSDDYTYDETTKTITFDTAPANKAVIVITYK